MRYVMMPSILDYFTYYQFFVLVGLGTFHILCLSTQCPQFSYLARHHTHRFQTAAVYPTCTWKVSDASSQTHAAHPSHRPCLPSGARMIRVNVLKALNRSVGSFVDNHRTRLLRQIQMIFWHQKTGNNVQVEGYDKAGDPKSPAYNSKMGFHDG